MNPRALHRRFVFARAMRTFLVDPSECSRPGHPVLSNLIYGWGNESWSALEGYLAGCLQAALLSDGPSLECGSGLTTVLVGAIAARRGFKHWALEHQPVWMERVERCLSSYGIGSVVLCSNPLRDYGSFHWYDPPLVAMPPAFALVLCDGPPGSTPGGRLGMLPIMRERLRTGSVILLDDLSRPEEQHIAAQWARELGSSFEVVHSGRSSYMRMRVASLE